MVIAVTHSAVVVVPDDPLYPVGSDEWNADHVLTGFGAGVATALAVNVGSTGGPVVNGGALGTPASGTATNLTGTAAGLTAGAANAAPLSGITGLGAGVGTALAVNVGSSGGPVVLNGVGGTPSSITLTNGTSLSAPGVTGTAATLTVAGQTLSGGAVVTSLDQGTMTTGTHTASPGLRPLQFIANGGAFALAAPVSDGSMILEVTNITAAGTITFAGFSVGTSIGDPLTTVQGNTFAIHIWRVNSIAGYRIAANQ